MKPKKGIFLSAVKLPPFLLTVLALAFCTPTGALSQRDVTTLTCLINHTWYPSDSFTGVIPEEITRQTGVKLDVTVARDTRQVNMLLASGELPDLIFTGSQFDMLSSEKYCYDYDTLIERYGIDWTIDDDLRSNALRYSSDGKLYTVINHYTRTEDWQDTAAVPMTASLMVRQDILDALGNPPLRTTDDLLAVYLRVQKAYPDMVPLTFDTTHRFNAFRAYFGLGLAEFIEQEDGTYRYYARDARYRDMLAYLNRLYRHGLLIIDSFAAVPMQSSALYKQGKAFSHSGCTQNYNLGLNNDLRALDPSFHSVEMRPLEGSVYSTSNLGWSGVFITKACRDPETAMRFVAWMFTPEAQRLTQWGREGIDYVLDEDKLPIFSGALTTSIREDAYVAGYNPWFHLGASAIVEAEGRCALLDYEDYEQTYAEIRALYRNLPWIVASMPKEGAAERDVYDRAASMAISAETRIILSEGDDAFEANFGEYMRQLDAMGIASLEAYMSREIPVVMDQYTTVGE